MKDFLADIVSHTQSIGINIIKITGDDKETVINSFNKELKLVFNAKFNTPNPSFTGVFGMPNLDKLNTILNIPEYAEDSKLSLTTETRNGETVASGLHFENAAGDFKNDYRFMATEAINGALKNVIFKGTSWDVTVSPTISSINRFKFQSQVNRDEKKFSAKTEGTDLKFYFGDPSTQAGNFVFQSGVTGSIPKPLTWTIGTFASILNLQGDKTIQISNAGVAKITVNSGLITYEYLLSCEV